MSRFDQCDPKWYFQELTHLKQTKLVEEFANQFQYVSMIVGNLSQRQLTDMFIEGPKDSNKSLVNPLETQNLEEAIRKAKKVESNTHKERPKSSTSIKSYPNEGEANRLTSNHKLILVGNSKAC